MGVELKPRDRYFSVEAKYVQEMGVRPGGDGSRDFLTKADSDNGMYLRNDHTRSPTDGTDPNEV